MSAADFKAKGNKHLQAKEFDEAIQAYTEAINIDPTDHVFFSNRSAAYLSKGDANNALSDAERCVSLNPTWPKGYSRKGASLHALKRYDDAIATYDEGLQAVPGDATLLQAKEDCTRAKESSSGGAGGMGGLFGPQMLAKLIGHPKFGPKLGDPAFMAKLQNMQKNPQMMMQDPEMMEVLQALLGGMGGPDGPATGASDFTPASTSAPKQEPVKEPEPELTEEEKAAKDIKDRALAAKNRGNDLYKKKNFEEALKAYDEAMEIDPENVMILSNKAAVYIEMNNTDKAIEICTDLLEKSPKGFPYENKAKLYSRIAGAHVKKGDFEAAVASYKKAQIEFFDKAVERKMKNIELEQKKRKLQEYINPELGAEAKERGNVAFRNSDFPTAIKEYEEAVKRDPSSAAYFNNLAAAYLKMGVFNDAKRSVEKSLELDPNYVKAWAKKGDIEFFMKEYHKSLDSYKAGLQLEANNELCKNGLQKTMSKINELNNSGEVDAERQAHALQDPEIQQILQDPSVKQVLRDFQENPTYAQKAMGDPNIRTKIEKLVSAGILQVK